MEPICTLVATEIDSACSIEIAPVAKSTTKVTDPVCIPTDIVEIVPALDEAVTFVAATSLSEKVMYCALSL